MQISHKFNIPWWPPHCASEKNIRLHMLSWSAQTQPPIRTPFYATQDHQYRVADRTLNSQLWATYPPLHHRNSPFCPFSPSSLCFVSAGLSSLNPRFFNSSFAIRFLQEMYQSAVSTRTWRSYAPVHPAWQIRFGQIPALGIIQAFDFLHAREVARHHIFAFSYARDISYLRSSIWLPKNAVGGRSSRMINRTVMIKRKASTLRSVPISLQLPRNRSRTLRRRLCRDLATSRSSESAHFVVGVLLNLPLEINSSWRRHGRKRGNDRR